MDHPLLTSENTSLRERVVSLFREGLSFIGKSNIVFVCGGNADGDMRPKFIKYANRYLRDHLIFMPEYALPFYLQTEYSEPFLITEFESIVADISHSIVLFPEAPGSFAEIGYFANMPNIANKTIVALDSKFQGKDSFISYGPASIIARISFFRPEIQIDYGKPRFPIIRERIERKSLSTNLKSVDLTNFKKVNNFHLFCALIELIDFLRISTIDDLLKFSSLIFRRPKPNLMTIKKLISMMIGAGYIEIIGSYGHLKVSKSRPKFAQARMGKGNEFIEIRMEILGAINATRGEFSILFTESFNDN